MRLVFNELSAGTLAASRQQAREWMDGLVRGTASLAREGTIEIITVGDFSLFGMMLSHRYTLSDWLGDREADRDQVLFFRRRATNIISDDLTDQVVADGFHLSEFYLEDQAETARPEPEARGLGLAFLLDTVALSLPSAERWQSLRIRLRRLWLEADGSERERIVDVFNLSKVEHGRPVVDEMVRREQNQLRANPLKLIENTRSCFPHLSFGEEVKDQMAELPIDVRRQVIAKFIVLDGAARDWRRGATDAPALPKIHPESEPTMQQFGDLRKFRGANGRIEVFKLHAMVGNRHRIHLRILEKEKSLQIGYVGVHLPTTTFHH